MSKSGKEWKNKQDRVRQARKQKRDRRNGEYVKAYRKAA